MQALDEVATCSRRHDPHYRVRIDDSLAIEETVCDLVDSAVASDANDQFRSIPDSRPGDVNGLGRFIRKLVLIFRTKPSNDCLNSLRNTFRASLICTHLLRVRPLLDSGFTITCVFRYIPNSFNLFYDLFFPE